ncbi:MAG: hypothetical protein H0V17_31530 [Deltaproteobacteria bacterium]|nr:hypothetical protein [Deltaproteobacteria bacterium]
MRPLLALTLLMFAACERAEAHPTTAEAKPPTPKRLRVEWSNVKTTAPGCFFFSGPKGRDIQLTGTATVERSGTEVAIVFSQATFRGELTDGGFVVTRRGTHDFDGPWTVKETIRGRFVDGAVLSRYHYEECQDGADACPGECMIDGDLRLRP